MANILLKFAAQHCTQVDKIAGMTHLMKEKATMVTEIIESDKSIKNKHMKRVWTKIMVSLNLIL